MITDKTYNPILRITITAAEDLPANRLVDFNGNLAADEIFLGVTDYPALAGESVSLIVLGSAIVECTGTILAGGDVAISSNGIVKPFEVGDTILGRSINGNSGNYITLLLR
ncbi:MAG: hypothetical protein A2X64_02850 [Ignavibacteria bacterium GWF2_33_9]|nr:MAG: hypothetical protein A2X64_02850 [Ignavibacteria bacterium GWF2_33_9]